MHCKNFRFKKLAVTVLSRFDSSNQESNLLTQESNLENQESTLQEILQFWVCVHLLINLQESNLQNLDSTLPCTSQDHLGLSCLIFKSSKLKSRIFSSKSRLSIWRVESPLHLTRVPNSLDWESNLQKWRVES